MWNQGIFVKLDNSLSFIYLTIPSISYSWQFRHFGTLDKKSEEYANGRSLSPDESYQISGIPYQNLTHEFNIARKRQEGESSNRGMTHDDIFYAYKYDIWWFFNLYVCWYDI